MMIPSSKGKSLQVFAGKDSTITDDDIDTILAKAEQKTEELNKKMEVLGESSLR